MRAREVSRALRRGYFAFVQLWLATFHYSPATAWEGGSGARRPYAAPS
jgi:hypothetical protein